MTSISSDALAQIPKKISLHSQLPNFRDIPPNQKTILFISKLRQCNKLVRVDDQDLRKLKHLVLYQLLEYVNMCSNQFPVEAVPDFFNTVSVNIFRQAQKPQAEEEDTYDPDEDEPTVDPAWYHLQFVYEMLLRFVYSAQSQNPDYQKVVKKYIDCDFVIRLIQLFNQSDPRERDYVKTILHRIYANVMSLRAYVRLTLRSELQSFYSGKQQHSGVCDILEVLGSIINGYAVPLKAEHLQFLQQCLLPLHRVQHVKQILPQLSYCVSKFLEKDPKLSAYIIHQILLCYPRLNSHKEVTVLTELEELLELVIPDSLFLGKDEKLWPAPVNNPLAVYTLLFKTVAQAVCSLHFQVAERAISMLSNPKFLVHVQAAYRKWAEMYSQYGLTGPGAGLGVLVEEEEEDGFAGAGGTFGAQNEQQAIPVELPGIAGQQQGFQAAALAARNNPVVLLAMSLRANQQGHWNTNIRINSEQALKQLSTVSTSEVQNIDQKMLNELVFSETLRQIREATGQDVAQHAMGNVSKFGDYFKTYNVRDRTTHYLPGYEAEIIAPGKVLAAVVPEDPLFCRAEEMALKGFNLTSEQVLGAIDGAMLEVGAQQPNPKIDGSAESTACDKLLQKGFDLQDAALRSRIMQAAAEALAATGALNAARPELPSARLITVQSKLPPPRIMSRRPSAGVPATLGIRRKSVTPLTAQQALAKKELKNFEKHSVNDAKK